MGKVAAIGTVNPRRGGPVNALVQGWKRLVARVLDWHVREQVEFNRKTVACLDAAIEALNENNRALVELGNHTATALAAANTGAVSRSPQSLDGVARGMGTQTRAHRDPVLAQPGRSARRRTAALGHHGDRLARHAALAAQGF